MCKVVLFVAVDGDRMTKEWRGVEGKCMGVGGGYEQRMGTEDNVNKEN